MCASCDEAGQTMTQQHLDLLNDSLAFTQQLPQVKNLKSQLYGHFTQQVE